MTYRVRIEKNEQIYLMDLRNRKDLDKFMAKTNPDESIIPVKVYEVKKHSRHVSQETLVYDNGVKAKERKIGFV